MENKGNPGEKPGESVSDSRRSFFKTVGAGAVLLAATSLGAGSFSKVANAQDQYVTIEGQTVKITKIDKHLAELGRETQKYRRPETTDPTSGYQVDVRVPEEVTFLVTLNAVKEGGKKESNLNILYPKERDSPNVPEHSRGGSSASLNSFVELVKKTTGQDAKRVEIVLEQGTFDYQGNDAKYYTAYIIPIDSQGKRITSRGAGKYLAFEAGYFYYNGGAVSGVEPNSHGIDLLVEPSASGAIARR